MIVEFIGESGCGKTTLADSVFTKTDGAVRKGSKSTWDNFCAILKFSRNKNLRKIYSGIISLAFSTNRFRRFFKNSFYLAGHVDVMRQDLEDPGMWIIDQGYLQFLQTIFFDKEPSNDDYRQVVKKLTDNMDYYVVACKCDTLTLLNRINKRREDRTRGQSADSYNRRIENANKELLELHDKNMERVLSCIPEDRFIIIDTSDDLEKNAARVSEFIQSKRRRSDK